MAVLACLLTGAVIGTAIGLLVARLGIPSFVVTLAVFLALQGVLLKIIGEGGTIAIRDSKLLAINNNTMPVWLGWALYVGHRGGVRGWSRCAGPPAGGPAACSPRASR